VDLQVRVQQALEIAGEQGVRSEVAERSRATRRAVLDRVRWELHHRIHATYHRALMARERVRVAERLLAFHDRLSRVAERRAAIGEGSPLDARLAGVERLRARQRVSRERQSYLDARLLLAELSGWRSDAPPLPAGELEEPRRAPPVPRLVEVALAEGPELAVRRAAEAEARARADLAHRDGWPEPVIGVRYQIEGNPNGGPREHSILGVVGLPLPLWHRNPVGRAQAETDLEVATARREVTERLLRARITRLVAAVNASADRLELYQDELVPAFETQLEQLQRAFELGEIDLLRVSVARDHLLTARLEALDAYATYFDAITALADAVGADPWPDRHHVEASGGDR
jgi:cobalt-zinc-cadmium efflux system outer membrane protein